MRENPSRARDDQHVFRVVLRRRTAAGRHFPKREKHQATPKKAIACTKPVERQSRNAVVKQPLHVVRQSNIPVVYCPPRIVVGETEELQATVLAAIEETGRAILQLQEVEYVDSSGLGLLAWLSVSARERSGDVLLVAPQGYVQHLFEVTMLRRVLHIYPTVESALAAMTTAISSRES